MGFKKRNKKADDAEFNRRYDKALGLKKGRAALLRSGLVRNYVVNNEPHLSDKERTEKIIELLDLFFYENTPNISQSTIAVKRTNRTPHNVNSLKEHVISHWNKGESNE